MVRVCVYLLDDDMGEKEGGREWLARQQSGQGSGRPLSMSMRNHIGPTRWRNHLQSPATLAGPMTTALLLHTALLLPLLPWLPLLHNRRSTFRREKREVTE